MLPPASFHKLILPSGESAWIPEDVELRIPDTTSLAAADLHYLIYIPWRSSYVELIEPGYRDFFQVVLPYLHTRTTDVHVATCFPFIRELIQAASEPVDEQVVRIAFLLHDSGWSQMSDVEIAHSLGVQGLSLSGEAINPKARHAVLGQAVAEKVLGEYEFQPTLSGAQKDMIYQAILFHDKPEELAASGEIPPSLKLVCDVDHQWSFTHANFWQDTVRKGNRPDEYLANLGRDLESYFVTEAGKQKARHQLEERQREVEAWSRLG
ncbi:MAG TPA: hypothetical protein VMC09_04735 [Anaerolineales bacterium]|nr:hypothetical protein [Anaerolineales bacterium]